MNVELIGLTKRYGAAIAVDGIDLKVPSGAYCCLLGPRVAARPRRCG